MASSPPEKKRGGPSGEGVGGPSSEPAKRSTLSFFPTAAAKRLPGRGELPPAKVPRELRGLGVVQGAHAPPRPRASPPAPPRRTPVPPPPSPRTPAGAPRPPAAAAGAPAVKGARPAASPPAVHELPAITAFGRYEILGRLAFGGMAEIFLARETTSVGAARLLVVKRILPHVANDSQFVQMFLDEARLAIQLSHPNICHIYEFGELDASYFIAMEWINGKTLGKLIREARKAGGLPPKICARILAQVAEALHYAHNAKDAVGQPLGIVHRDVTPHNIMIGFDGQVKLLDFGIAKASTHASKTEAGVIKGKFSYMSPQQCTGLEIDARADVFALGICLWEALTGKALYHRKNEYETMKAVIDEPPRSIRSIDADLPVELDAICTKALQKDPADRFQSAGEVQIALEEFIMSERAVVNATVVAATMSELFAEQIERGPLVDSTPFGESFKRKKNRNAYSASAPSQLTGAPERDPLAASSRPRKRPWLQAILGAALLVGGVGAGAWIMRGAGEPAPAPREVAEPAPPPEEVAAEGAPGPAGEGEEGDEAPAVGTLLLTSTPPGATVALGGRELEGLTPLSVDDVAVGTHEVRVTRDGHAPWTGTVEVRAGTVTTVSAELAAAPRRPAAPARPPGRLSINTRPWSKVYVGPRMLGTTPIAGARVTSGVVRLRLVDRDGQTHRRTVRVPPHAGQRVFYDLR